MTAPKTPETATADDELTDDDLEQITGGTKALPEPIHDVTTNKQKTADKKYDEMDKIIKA